MQIGEGLVDVRVVATETSNGGQSLIFAANLTGNTTWKLWNWGINVAARSSVDEYGIFQNYGFGNVHNCSNSNGCQAFFGTYPGEAATMQCLSMWNRHGGVYVGAHDETFATKVFGYSAGSHFSVKQDVPDPNTTLIFRSKYSLVIEPFRGDWYDMTQIYRKFAVNVLGTKNVKPFSKRTDLPGWLETTSVWVNSHWQEHDVFSKTGGDPTVVENRVNNIIKRFNLNGSLGLHWYEWDDLGYKHGSQYENCTSDYCGFDTNYPEYFPARSDFGKVVHRLRQKGIVVAPYINGRIFDMGTKSWNGQNITAAATQEDGARYEESYGSHASFAVMCPASATWQDILATTVSRLASEFSVDMVYIDQIGAAGPKQCCSGKAHNHSNHGGHYWATGQNTMANKAKHNSNGILLMTEGLAESYIPSIDYFLPLQSSSVPYTGAIHVVPAFPAVYGGFYAAAGSKFYTQDLAQDPDQFTAKLTKQYILGMHLGWFSLGGLHYSKSKDMALYDQLMSSKSDPAIAYLSKVEFAKQRLKNFFIYGRATKPLPGILPREDIMGSTWLNEQSSCLLITFATPFANFTSTSPTKFRISNTTDFGLEPNAHIFQVANLNITTGNWERTGLGLTQEAVEFQIQFKPRQVYATRICSHARNNWTP
mmetsp:Transcript_30375/g.48477  ORF Transcript_30375/g.48477 Transcript_30375/m.48477 type:complete len:650 (+) Transcript_30375:379-2328(+)